MLKEEFTFFDIVIEILGVTQARWRNTLENDFELKKIYFYGV